MNGPIQEFKCCLTAIKRFQLTPVSAEFGIIRSTKIGVLPHIAMRNLGSSILSDRILLSKISTSFGNIFCSTFQAYLESTKGGFKHSVKGAEPDTLGYMKRVYIE